MAYDDSDRQRALKRVIKYLIIWSVVMLILSLLASCKQVEYVTVEKVRTDTTYITKWQKDSVWLHDSTYVKEKGDTVLIEKWHTQWRDRLRVDTIIKATHDTIPQPYPVIKEVPAELSWWQRLRIILGNFVILAVIAIAGYWVWRLWRVYKFF
jgi:hypothetical protein